MTKQRILIAGIGSGSLGIELVKCFSLTNEFELYGADISDNAYGHNDSRFIQTTVLDRSNYAQSLLAYALRIKADIIAPGAEATGKILSSERELFQKNNIDLMINSREVIDLCSDKVKCNSVIAEKGFKTAHTILASTRSDLTGFNAYPCVVKPAKNSGGSNMVFLAENFEETAFFVKYIADRGFEVCVQEYIDSDEEFTVGVLSNREGKIISSVALKRNLEAKLSRSLAYGNRVISSGWSQGKIDHYSDVCKQAEEIAVAIGSTWALNLQGRYKNGKFIPFEINPRHSGTSFARAEAGINEPVLALRYLNKELSQRPKLELKPGTFIRVLAESFIPEK